MRVDAIVLAGAKNDGKLQQVDSAKYEALIDIGGKAMVDYVLATLRGCSVVDRIVTVGPEEVRQGVTVPNIEFALSGDSMIDNIRIGIDALHSSSKVLVVTSDIPLIAPEAILDFVTRCEAEQADIYYPVTAKEVNESKYPGVHRTYVSLCEGVFTGGNLVLLAPESVERGHNLIAKAIEMRKKPWQLARLLGFSSLVKLLCHRLSIKEIEARVERILGFRGVGIISPYPEVGIDVDKPSDLELVRRVLVSNPRA